jgi:hypothetical protein
VPTLVKVPLGKHALWPHPCQSHLSIREAFCQILMKTGTNESVNWTLQKYTLAYTFNYIRKAWLSLALTLLRDVFIFLINSCSMSGILLVLDWMVLRLQCWYQGWQFLSSEINKEETEGKSEKEKSQHCLTKCKVQNFWLCSIMSVMWWDLRQ